MVVCSCFPRVVISVLASGFSTAVRLHGLTRRVGRQALNSVKSKQGYVLVLGCAADRVRDSQ